MPAVAKRLGATGLLECKRLTVGAAAGAGTNTGVGTGTATGTGGPTGTGTGTGTGAGTGIAVVVAGTGAGTGTGVGATALTCTVSASAVPAERVIWPPLLKPVTSASWSVVAPAAASAVKVVIIGGTAVGGAAVGAWEFTPRIASASARAKVLVMTW